MTVKQLWGGILLALVVIVASVTGVVQVSCTALAHRDVESVNHTTRLG